MKIILDYEVKNCRECPLSTNSSIMHNDAFTSEPHPTRWYCTKDNRYIKDEYVVDPGCVMREPK